MSSYDFFEDVISPLPQGDAPDSIGVMRGVTFVRRFRGVQESLTLALHQATTAQKNVDCLSSPAVLLLLFIKMAKHQVHGADYKIGGLAWQWLADSSGCGKIGAETQIGADGKEVNRL